MQTEGYITVLRTGEVAEVSMELSYVGTRSASARAAPGVAGFNH